MRLPKRQSRVTSRMVWNIQNLNLAFSIGLLAELADYEGRREMGITLFAPCSPALTPQEQLEEIPKEENILWMGNPAQKHWETRTEEEELNESMTLSASRTKHVLFLAIAALEPSVPWQGISLTSGTVYLQGVGLWYSGCTCICFSSHQGAFIPIWLEKVGRLVRVEVTSLVWNTAGFNLLRTVDNYTGSLQTTPATSHSWQ